MCQNIEGNIFSAFPRSGSKAEDIKEKDLKLVITMTSIAMAALQPGGARKPTGLTFGRVVIVKKLKKDYGRFMVVVYLRKIRPTQL